MKIRNLMLALAGTTLVFSACEKDPDPKVPTADANIALATILPKSRRNDRSSLPATDP